MANQYYDGARSQGGRGGGRSASDTMDAGLVFLSMGDNMA